ncbi:hypothetical protein [Methylocystis parvus]|uniref:hypothetical protein n=1 Tax=Methylocystis parvus TaxID=134 RepID=UPI003C77A37F
MHILFDAKSSQVEVHLETGTRLKELFRAIESRGWKHTISQHRDGSPLTPQELEGVDVLCILTRLRQQAPEKPRTPYPPGTIWPPLPNPFPENANFQFPPEELTAIQAFVNQGHGLLLISDHGPFDGNKTDIQTINDCQLAAAFGVQVQPATFEDQSQGMLSITSFGQDPVVAKILAGVSELQAHNSCAIFPMNGVTSYPIALLPDRADGVLNRSPINHMPPDGLPFALLVPYGDNNGAVIIAGNSGISGDADSPFPAPGLIDAADNKTFLMNCLEFLGPIS